MGAQRGAKIKIGMNETAIGLQLPEFGWHLGKYRLDNKVFTRAVTQATTYDLVSATTIGYIDELVDGDLLPAAIAEACRLGSHCKQPAFARMKLAERGGLIEMVTSNIKRNVADCMN